MQEELIFSEAPEQGMDMHSFYDPVEAVIWYPYKDYGGTQQNSNHLIKYDPATDTIVDTFALATTPATNHQAYQAIQGNDPNVIWVYSGYGTRALWKFFKDDPLNSEYVPLEADGNFGGKISSMVIDGIEHIVSTIVSGSPLDQTYTTAYNTDTKATPTEIPALGGSGNYGLQNDGTNFFIIDGSNLRAFQLTSGHVLNISATITTFGGLDIAWDGTDIWTNAQGEPHKQFIEKFTPVYTGDIVTSFIRGDAHETGFPRQGGRASIKADDRYVGACYESLTNDPPTLGWSILDKATGIWTDVFNQVAQQVTPEGVYPFVDQFWTTTTIEIGAPDAIYISGYAPALQGGVMNLTNCPSKDMRLVKITPQVIQLEDVILEGVTLS